MTLSMKMQDVREEAWEEAQMQTQETDIHNMILTVKHYNIPAKQAGQMVSEAFDLSLAEAEAKVQQYWEA